MADQIYIGNFAKGLKLNPLPFNIDNDSFPMMFNFYSWRGRAKRKRGTLFLGRLTRQLSNLVSSLGLISPGPGIVVYNIFASFLTFSGQSGAQIVPGNISPITIVIGAVIATDTTGTGVLSFAPNPFISSITLNYSSGDLTVVTTAAFVAAVTITLNYYPGLPVMGLRDFSSTPTSSTYPLLLAFDTVYSYQCNQSATSAVFFSTSYYKQSNNPIVWSGQDYQQFWTTNYPGTTANFSGSLWATNNKPGFHFVNASYVSGSGTSVITFNFTSSGNPYQNLVVNDLLWFNEWSGSTINGLNGTVTNIVNAATGTYQVTFSGSQTVGGTGIAQLLTNSISGQDGIRWYDGDPTSGTGLPTGTGLGWVNFSPPLTATSVSIAGSISRGYYLVGALAIIPFKDRLVFFGPYIQASTGPLIQLPDTALWSWNGTPYYNSLVPTGQTFDVRAYYVDQTGFGGYLPAGLSQPIKTINNNEDALIVGFGGDGRKTRFVYTGNDLQPFLFFNINTELPSSSTFSAVSMDRGVIDLGQYGIAMTDQQSSQRIDLDIPDSVFQVQSLNNGFDRVNSVRDYFREWIYFSYPVNNSSWKFPTQTFLYNYRDDTWGIMYENFTAHGYYRAQNKRSWQTLPFKTWAEWREPWNSGSSSSLFTQVIAGTPQGYVLIKGQGTGEAPSGTITAIANAGGLTQITSYNHCVTGANPNTRVGDYLYIQGCLGTPSLNGQIGRVISTADANTFIIDLLFPAGTYLGLGTFTRLSQPLLQTKQFPFYWNIGRKVRLCAQKYLMDYTANSQVTVNIYLSQDPDEVFNNPSINVPPNSLVYSQLMYTCPESVNIGLTPANTNLQMPTAEGQYQIWHRFNTSLIGDSIQIGVTLSDTQMRNLTYSTSEIALHGMQLTLSPGPLLA